MFFCRWQKDASRLFLYNHSWQTTFLLSHQFQQDLDSIGKLMFNKINYPDEAEVVDRLIQEVESGKRWNMWQVLN